MHIPESRGARNPFACAEHGLPPRVGGETHGFVSLEVSHRPLQNWQEEEGTDSNRGGALLVECHWWGEAGAPTVLRVEPGSAAGVAFPVRSRLGHLLNYFGDAAALELRVSAQQSGAALGQAAVPLSGFDQENPVHGSYEIVPEGGQPAGCLDVSLQLQLGPGSGVADLGLQPQVIMLVTLLRVPIAIAASR